MWTSGNKYVITIMDVNDIIYAYKVLLQLLKFMY